MRRIFLSFLLTLTLLAGLMQPIFATGEPTVEAAEETTVQPSEETAAPEELPSEGLQEDPSALPGETVRAPGAFTVSQEGLNFIGEMMVYNASQLAAAEESINRFINKYSLDLSQSQFDALVDLEMAYGGNMFASGYQVERVIASGSYTDAQLATAFCAWVKGANGVLSDARLSRRLREIKLFLYGSYDGRCEANFRYLIFDANGGKLNNNTVICYTLNAPYGSLPTASREENHFLGWFTAASGGTQLLSTDTVTDNHRVYARWSDSAPAQAFTDVPVDAWYCSYVMKVVEAGLFSGVSATEFEPEGTLTRAMLATVLWRMDGKKQASNAAPFVDVPAGQWYTDAVHWAYEKGIVNGVTDTEFAPDDNITREQLTTMLYRYAAGHGYDVSGQASLNSFADGEAVSAYALAPLQWAVNAAIVNGDGGYLSPQGEATRAQCAKMIAVFSGLSAGTTPDPGPEIPTLKVSEACIQFIKNNEGFSKNAYWDYGQYSIGYGSYCNPEDYPNGITEEEADLLLRLELVDFEATVDKVLAKGTVQHTQNQYDAILSLTYNLGQQWVNSQYKIYEYILYGGFTDIDFVNTLGSWCNAGGSVLIGLCSRRMEEADMYLNGDYSLGNAPYRCLIFNGLPGVSDDKLHYYKAGSTVNELPGATREGYRFTGWFDKSSGGTQFTAGSTVPSRMVTMLYAHWEALTE